MGKNGCGRKLKRLDLSGCKNITDVTLHRLSSALGCIHDDTTDKGVNNNETMGEEKCVVKITEIVSPSFDNEKVNEALRTACDWLEGNLMASRLYEMIENEKMPPSWTSRDSRFIEDTENLTSAYYHCVNWIKAHSPTTRTNVNSWGGGVADDLMQPVNSRTFSATSSQISSDQPARTRASYCEANAGCRGYLDRTYGSRSPVCDSEPSCDMDTSGARGLEYLCLSGCYKVTDSGLR